MAVLFSIFYRIYKFPLIHIASTLGVLFVLYVKELMSCNGGYYET